jgi:hypothetical protein
MADSTVACICTTDAGTGCDVSPSIVLLLGLWSIVVWIGQRGHHLVRQDYCIVILPIAAYDSHSMHVHSIFPGPIFTVYQLTSKNIGKPLRDPPPLTQCSVY